MTTPAAPSPVYRLLALVWSALIKVGLQHVAEPRREGQDGGTVVVQLWANAKLHYEVARLSASVTQALTAVGVIVTPVRSLVLGVAPASPEILQALPSIEGLAAVCQMALRARMRTLGCPGADQVQVRGISASGGGHGGVYVTGGDEDTNQKAVAWSMRWMGRHFPEVEASEGKHHVSGLEAERRGPGEWERVIMVVMPATAGGRAA